MFKAFKEVPTCLEPNHYAHDSWEIQPRRQISTTGQKRNHVCSYLWSDTKSDGGQLLFPKRRPYSDSAISAQEVQDRVSAASSNNQLYTTP